MKEQPLFSCLFVPVGNGEDMAPIETLLTSQPEPPRPSAATAVQVAPAAQITQSRWDWRWDSRKWPPSAP